MRHVIMVSPNYRRARSNRDFFWQEAEVINSYLGLAGTGDRCLLWVASLRLHKAEEDEANSQDADDNFRSQVIAPSGAAAALLAMEAIE
jgi:hypothetical protein